MTSSNKILVNNNADLEFELAHTYDSLEDAKADTVRKMQNKLKKTFSALCKGEMGDFYRIIDQIAKEMLEDKK